MRKFLIHIGPHKTGTTSLQRSFMGNTDVLADAGWAYPDVGVVDAGHHRFVEALADDPRWSQEDMIQSINAIGRNVLLSSENFSRLNAQSVRNLIKLTDSDQVHVVYYLRNPMALLYAWWAELAKHGYTETLPEFLCANLARPFHSHLMNAAGTIQTWLDEVPSCSVSVLFYDQKPDIVPDFWRVMLGIAPETLASSAKYHTNKSHDFVDTEAILFLNRLGYRGMQVKSASSAWADIVHHGNAEWRSTYERSIDLSLDTMVFRTFEKRMIELMRSALNKDRVDYPVDGISTNASGQAILFENRKVQMPYLDQMAWHSPEKIGDQLVELAQAQ